MCNTASLITMLWIHLFGIFTIISMGTIRSIQGQDTLPSEEISFTDAMKKCRLATPDISFKDDIPTLDFRDQGLILNVGDEAWVGYASDFALYQYLGCVRSKDAVEVSGPFETGAKPGFCQVACGKGYYGIMKKHCYCFDSVPTVDVQRSTCYLDCEQPDHGGVCGDWRSISMYTEVDFPEQIVSVDANPNDLDGNCVVYDENARKFSYTKCSLSFDVGCMTAAEFPYEFDRMFLSWTAMTRHCFKQRLFPLSHSSSERLRGTSKHAWTGMFRSKTIYSVYSGDHAEYHNYGYVRIDKSGVPSLRFESASNNVKKRYLCQENGVDVITSHQPSLPSLRKNESTTREAGVTSGTKKTTSEADVHFTSGSTESTIATKMNNVVRDSDGLTRNTEILSKTTKEVTINSKPKISSTVVFDSSSESVMTNSIPLEKEIINKTTVTDDQLSTYSLITKPLTVIGNSARESGFSWKTQSTTKNGFPTSNATGKITKTKKKNETNVTTKQTLFDGPTDKTVMLNRNNVKTIEHGDENRASVNREKDSKRILMPVYIIVPILCVLAIIILAIVLVVKKRRAERRRQFKADFVMPSWVTLMDMMYGGENNEHI